MDGIRLQSPGPASPSSTCKVSFPDILSLHTRPALHRKKLDIHPNSTFLPVIDFLSYERMMEFTMPEAHLERILTTIANESGYDVMLSLSKRPPTESSRASLRSEREASLFGNLVVLVARKACSDTPQ